MAKKKESITLISSKPKELLSKKLKVHTRSTFQNYRLKSKLLQELGLEMNLIMKWQAAKN